MELQGDVGVEPKTEVVVEDVERQLMGEITTSGGSEFIAFQLYISHIYRCSTAGAMVNGLYLYSSSLEPVATESALQRGLKFTQSYTHEHTDGSDGDSQLDWSSQG